MKSNNKILNEVQDIIKQNNNFTKSCLVAGSLIQENIEDMLPVLKYEPDNYIEVDVDVLQKLVSNCKVAENIINQAALNMFENKSEFEEYCIENDISIDTYKTFFEKFKIPSIVLIQYQRFLMKNKNMIDNNMTDFLDFLESDQKDNASFAYEELSELQKKTIPKNILEWLNDI